MYESNIDNVNEKLRVALVDFRRNNSDLPMSIIMEFCRLYRQEKISEDVLGSLIDAINAYLLKEMILNILMLFITFYIIVIQMT